MRRRNDTITGGAGSDVSVFTRVSNNPPGASGSINRTGPLYQKSGGGVRDVITEFPLGKDKIDLAAKSNCKGQPDVPNSTCVGPVQACR